MIQKLLKKIRWINLLVIAFTMYAMRYGIIYSFMKFNGLQLQLNSWYFLLIVLATVFIAAGGYIINDYFDKKIDEYNKIQINDNDTENTAEEKTSDEESEDENCCKRAMKFYNAFTLTGVILGVGVSILIDHYIFGSIFILAAGLLWFYSSTYKRIPFLGNIIVAVLAALVPFLTVIYDLPLIIDKYYWLFIKNESNIMVIPYFISGFSFFAFIMTFIREIIKDIEDYNGDKKYAKNTIPVVLGKTFAKILAGILIVAVIYAAFYYQTNYSGEKLSFWYILIFIISPLLYVIFRIIANSDKKGMHITSNILKLIMFFGISYAFVIGYLVLN